MKKILQGTKALAIALLLMMIATMVNAANRFAVASGNWNSILTWAATSGGAPGASVPIAGDVVTIEGGFTVTITANAACATLNVNTGSLVVGGFDLVVTGTTTINGTVTVNNVTGAKTFDNLVINTGGVFNSTVDEAFSLTGSLTVNGTGSLTSGLGAWTFSGTSTLDGTGSATISNADFTTDYTNSGTYTFADVDMAGGGTVTLTNNGTINVTNSITGEEFTQGATGILNFSGASIAVSSFQVTSAGNIVNYDGAVQTVRGASYSNLVLSGSGAKTTTGVTISTKLTMQGTATAGNSITYSTAILEYNGSAAQTTSLNEFSSNNADIDQVIINNANGVTLNNATTLNGANLTLTAGTFATGTNLTMGAGTPSITRSGGSMTGTVQGANNYDVFYIGSSKTTGSELSGSDLDDLTVTMTTGETLTLDQNRSPDANLAIVEGIFDIGTFTINRSAAGGTLTINNGGTLRIGGTNTFPSFYNTHTIENTNATVDYSGTAQSVIDLAGVENYTILILSGSGIKTLAAGITVEVLLSIQGTATTAGGSPTYLAASILEYKGSAAQNTSNVEFVGTGANPANLRIDNSNGVTLNAAKTINGALTLTNGLFTTTAVNVLSIANNGTASAGSNTAYVNGPLRKNGNDAFTFPVGKGGLYSPLTITAPNETGDGFTCEYFRASGTGLGGITSPGLTQVSNCEYWDLDESADPGNNTSISVTVNWYAGSGCGSNYITNYLTITLAHFNGVSWDSHAGTPSGNNTTGSITRTGVTVFSPFTLGSTNLNENPLPVNFSDVKAFEKGTGVQIEWTNLTEKDLVSYIVERSANGRDFTEIAQVAPRSNQADKESYTSFDASPMAGANFYRIKVLEIDGKVIYSKLLKVDIGRITKGISIYPNPVAGKEVTVGFSAIKGQYTLRIINAAGQEVFTQRLSHPGGNISQAVILPSSVRSGIYNMLITGDNYKETKMFVVQ